MRHRTNYEMNLDMKMNIVRTTVMVVDYTPINFNNVLIEKVVAVATQQLQGN